MYYARETLKKSLTHPKHLHFDSIHYENKQRISAFFFVLLLLSSYISVVCKIKDEKGSYYFFHRIFFIPPHPQICPYVIIYPTHPHKYLIFSVFHFDSPTLDPLLSTKTPAALSPRRESGPPDAVVICSGRHQNHDKILVNRAPGWYPRIYI